MVCRWSSGALVEGGAPRLVDAHAPLDQLGEQLPVLLHGVGNEAEKDAKE